MIRLRSGGPALAALLLLTALPAAAEGVEFSTSGFLTLAAGKILKGDAAQDFNGYRAPMFVTDYAQGGIYEKDGWTLHPDSKLGVQATATFGPRFSLTGQAVSRGVKNGKVDLEWVYGSYGVTDDIVIQFGRKRLPLFYYSETQDVGLANPWVHLPSGQYGWEIVNYNGANLLYRGRWGVYTTSINVFAGDETRRDNPYWKIYNGRTTRTDSRWSNIRGTDLTLTRDWFELRGAYIESALQNRFEDPTLPPPYAYTPKARQKIYSLSVSADPQHWVLRNEYLYMNRKPTGEEDWSFLFGIGYRIGKYLPMLTYNHYRMRLTPAFADPGVIDPASVDPLAAEAWSTLALSLRYDLTPESAVKMQLDWWKDSNGPNFNAGVPYGNARLFSVSYDRVF